jgi:hypothetical protein
MGKRNLTVAGTEEDFFADIFDEKTSADPSKVLGCASAEDAATSYFRNVFENSNANILSAAIAVWPVTSGPEKQLVFDAIAEITPCMEPDAEPGEINVVLDV